MNKPDIKKMRPATITSDGGPLYLWVPEFGTAADPQGGYWIVFI